MNLKVNIGEGLGRLLDERAAELGVTRSEAVRFGVCLLVFGFEISDESEEYVVLRRGRPSQKD